MYFITTICEKDDDTRCIGYFKTFKEAERIVLNNTCDINETVYDYAVIENIPEGLYQYDTNAKWYKWAGKEYKEVDKPKRYDPWAGFAIG